MPRRLTGIRRRRGGWQAYVRVAGTLHTKQFPIDHPVDQMRAWRRQQIDTFGGRRGAAGSLKEDVATLLAKPKIAAQKYVWQLEQHLMLWLDALGRDRPRHSITADEIESVLQRWLRRFSEPTVYHRRSALLSLFTTLDGPGAANPVKDTTCPKAWVPADHSVPFQTLARIIDAMPDRSYPKTGTTRPSTAKIISRVIVEVGIRPADLLRVRKVDIRFEDGTLRWPASAKGQGTSARTVPLTGGGVAALRAFDAAALYGRFSVAAVSHSFKRAARRLEGDDTPIHLYTGRHVVGADLYRATGDLATVGRMLNHTPGSRATAQYAQGANADVDQAAAAKLSAARQEQSARRKLPKKLPARRKTRQVNTLRKRS